MQNIRQDFVPGQHFHIYNRSNNREKVFPDIISKHFVLNNIEYYLGPHADIETHCILDNHFHFLLKFNELTESYLEFLAKTKDDSKAIQNYLDDQSERNFSLMISGQFQRCFTSLSIKLNKFHGRQGNLVNHRFKHKMVDPQDLHYTIAYIHNNPRHHRYTKDVNDWKYSGLKKSENWKKYFKGNLGELYHNALMDLVQARKTDTVELLPKETFEIINIFEKKQKVAP